MCGIIGYIGKQKASKILINALKNLEYRGYDSAGIAVREATDIKSVKKTGRVANVEAEVHQANLKGGVGIGHTRWATHGGVTEANTHPHISSDGKFVLVHNGVIENYQSLRKYLEEKGFDFKSETDTEAIVNLIAYHYRKEPDNTEDRFTSAVRKALIHLEGTYGIAVLCVDCPNEMVGARNGSPLILGLGKDENFLASDVSAFASRSKDVVYLNEGDIVHLHSDKYDITTIDSRNVSAIVESLDWDIEESELGNYTHFMEKEIFEQPQALENSMRGRFSDDNSTAKLGGIDLSPRELRSVDRFVMFGCGTTWHACLAAEYLIERFARIPVEVEYASEFRYRNAPISDDSLIFAFSQSGETIDTLAAMRESNRKGFRTLAITNVVGSSIARQTNGGGIYQHVGPEIGVASTKAFTSQVLLSSMIALYMGRLRDMSLGDGTNYVDALKSCPEMVDRILKQADSIREIAVRYSKFNDFLFMGRQAMFPIALEGALKLKEISYIHAEGYPAAEMKHGPIALISEDCPSVFLATSGRIMKKTLANMQEVKARNGKVISIVPEGTEVPKECADDVIFIPRCHEAIHPILATIPLQLLSYYIAVERGCDVDKPRNLAKSVTVE
jgi:glucosamine--fructose-6-phosphate aminotransferase (isomerizing)